MGTRVRMLAMLEQNASIENYRVYFSNYKIFRLSHILFISLVLLISRKNLICIGNFNCKVAQIVRRLRRTRSLVFYDDGTGTFRILGEWIGGPGVYFKSIFHSYFSGRQDVLKNEINLVPNRQIISSGEVLIIGTKLTENGYMSESTYVELLNKIDLVFQNKSVVYYPHVDERLQKLQEHGLTAQVKEIGCSVEEYLMGSPTIPKYIISMGSTAGLSLKIIFSYETYYLEISDLIQDTPHLPNAGAYFKRIESIFEFYGLNKLNLAQDIS